MGRSEGGQGKRSVVMLSEVEASGRARAAKKATRVTRATISAIY